MQFRGQKILSPLGKGSLFTGWEGMAANGIPYNPCLANHLIRLRLIFTQHTIWPSGIQKYRQQCVRFCSPIMTRPTKISPLDLKTFLTSCKSSPLQNKY